MPKQRMDLFARTLPLAYARLGDGQPHLLLHGGAGPGSMMGLASAIANSGMVVVPTHPGFDGEPRPDGFSRIHDLVLAYLSLIERLELERVVLIGNSVGGWIAAELALRGSPRIAAVVLLNSVGIDTGSPQIKIGDPAELSPQELAARAFYDPSKLLAPASAEAAAQLAENQRVLRVYAGEPFMHDPELKGRLAGMKTPSLVVWGESDRIVDVGYGRRLAAAMPGSRFELMPRAGHLPQLEQPAETRRLIEQFVAGLPR